MTGPNRAGFMDGDMLAFWRGLRGPLAGDLRLYGGTALALYLEHRESTDFDFVAPEPVIDLQFVRSLDWLRQGRANGGPGMVDVRLAGKGRDLVITLMEAGAIVPRPRYPPEHADNGVAVAHPFDLVAAKARACISREVSRDFIDLAEASAAWPTLTRKAVVADRDQPAARIAACLASPEPRIADALGHRRLALLRDLADDVFPAPDPRDDGPSP